MDELHNEGAAADSGPQGNSDLPALNGPGMEAIVQAVSGGASNIQDVYPLTPAQQALLFQSLLSPSGNAYVLSTLLELQSRADLGALIEAAQSVIDRHDVLRSAVFWEETPEPVQVVLLHAALPVEELNLDINADASAELRKRMRPELIDFDVRQAPLMRMQFAQATDGKCYALVQFHHIACDDRSRRTATKEMMACFERRKHELPAPIPYRNYVMDALAQARSESAEAFFRSKLGDIVEPTAPFGVLDIYGDGCRTQEVTLSVDSEVTRKIRSEARRLGVSAARMIHAAWAVVVAHTSAREDVVFGTVVSTAPPERPSAGRMLGMAINTLPLRLRVSGLSVEELVRSTHDELTLLLAHRTAPLELAQRCSGLSGSAPLFTALLNYRHREQAVEGAAVGSTTPKILLQLSARTNYPIAISVDDLGETGFEIMAVTNPRIDARRVANYLLTALQSLVEALDRAPDASAMCLRILPDEERVQLMQRFNATETSFPRHDSLHHLFEEQVKRSPDAVAVVADDVTLTYAQLNDKANRLARWLRRRGMRIGEYIPVHMPRSVSMIVAQLAVLKSGGVYVPLDAELPMERLAFMIRECAARCVLADRPRPQELDFDDVEWLDGLAEVEASEDLPADNLCLAVDPLPPAYVMFTSGSTGVPKGVVVAHRAVIRLAINNGFATIESQDCFAHHSSPAFDASTFEVWGALLNGARVLVVAEDIVLEPPRFLELLEREAVTTLYMSVGLFNQYARTPPPFFRQLRHLIVGGDSLQPDSIRRVRRYSPPQRLLNGYGPTECTTFSTTYLIESVDEDATNIPIGTPIANTQVYILNRYGEAVPLGVAGEIYLGGAGVACGYLNRPELTQERFVANPFSTDPRERLYRTGDLARWREDGAVEFLGRNDHQVKIRGFRVELSEIEANLNAHEDVSEAVVIARADEGQEKRLLAYVAPAPGVGAKSIAGRLRAHLRRKMPEYMTPSAIVVMDCLPLTKSGKVDRHALPEPDDSAFATRSFEAPEGATEQALADMWKQLLHLERMGRHDDFFELGGHSLLATQVAARIRDEFGLQAPMRLLFDCSTIATLAAQIDDLRRDRTLGKLANTDAAMSQLLEMVSAMPEREVRRRLEELSGGRGG